jgi:hypothetical protein
MSKLFISTSSGAGVYIFSDDHCPPHVHARHRGEGWIARIKFSFVTNVVQLISIAPLQNIPLQRVVSRLLDDIHARLDVCRRHWWNISRTTCLENQWMVPSRDGSLRVLPLRAAGARQVAASAYDPDNRQLRITFRDGTVFDLQSKMEPDK